MSKPKLISASDAKVIALLERHKCPTPFHEVRTRFLGSIASPIIGTSSMETVKQFWGGKFPEFDSLVDLNELHRALIADLWNRLTAHQNSRNLFRLLHFDVAQTREGLSHLALVRRQELDGFIEGLFGPDEHIDLPERAHDALGVLSEMRVMLVGIASMLEDSSKPVGPDDIRKLLHNIQELTIIVETEMNNTNLSCKYTHGLALGQMPATRPTVR